MENLEKNSVKIYNLKNKIIDTIRKEINDEITKD